MRERRERERERERERGKNESEDNPRTAGIQKRNTFASQDKKVGRKESEIKSKAFVRWNHRFEKNWNFAYFTKHDIDS